MARNFLPEPKGESSTPTLGKTSLSSKGTNMNGSATCGERVVIVQVHSGRVKLKTGRISTPDPDRSGNGAKTVVRGDQRFRPVDDTPEEAYEKTFEANDIHLLKEQEARSLGTLEAVQNWFGMIYQDRVLGRIQRALKRLGP